MRRALLLALAVSGVAVAGIRTVDPKAFSLQQREEAEREGRGAGEGVKAGDRDANEHNEDRD